MKVLLSKVMVFVLVINSILSKKWLWIDMNKCKLENAGELL